MAKARLRVRHLTLAAHSNLSGDRDDEGSNDEDDQAKLHLDRERLARTIELSVADGAGNRR
jgi:hypothetical protein